VLKQIIDWKNKGYDTDGFNVPEKYWGNEDAEYDVNKKVFTAPVYSDTPLDEPGNFPEYECDDGSIIEIDKNYNPFFTFLNKKPLKSHPKIS